MNSNKRAIDKEYLLQQFRNYHSSIAKPALDEKVSVVRIKKAEYDALPMSSKMDKSIIYDITDVEMYDPENPENFEKEPIDFVNDWV